MFEEMTHCCRKEIVFGVDGSAWACTVDTRPFPRALGLF